MDEMDMEKVARVFQRVQGEPEGIALQQLLQDAAATAADYLRLHRRYRGQRQQQLRTLYVAQRSQLSCLRGLYLLTQGSCPRVQLKHSEPLEPQAMLRQCYSRHMRCLAGYDAHRRDPEHGKVFAQLLQAEQEQCRRLLLLLGQWCSPP